MTDEQTATAGLPQPPPHLSDSSAAWFRDVVGKYKLEPHELRLLTLACEALDEVDEAREIIEADGLVITNYHGNEKRHPAARVRDKAATRFYRLVEKLGISEASNGKT